jgi:hypothetical protein
MSNAIQTDVLGYFNPNDYPIQISTGRLGLQFNVGSKKHIIDSDGLKVNDPELAKHVGVGLLAAEKSPNGQLVPINHLRRPVKPNRERGTSVISGSQNVFIDVHGEALRPTMPNAQTKVEDGRQLGNPVKGFTVNEAVNAGLINAPIGFEANQDNGSSNPRDIQTGTSRNVPRQAKANPYSGLKERAISAPQPIVEEAQEIDDVPITTDMSALLGKALGTTKPVEQAIPVSPASVEPTPMVAIEETGKKRRRRKSKDQPSDEPQV